MVLPMLLRPRLARWTPGLLLALAVATSCSPGPGVRVVLVTVDTLRLDAFEKPGLMPHTRAWAAQGAEFERAYAATSSTQPTHASLFTGLYPWEHGVVQNGAVLPEKAETVAERFAEAGFETAAVVASAVLAEHARNGMQQGFDHYSDGGWLEAAAAGEDEGFYSLAGDVNERAFALLDSMHSDRQFIWIHYFDPHAPYGDDPGSEEDALGYQYESRELVRRAHHLYEQDVHQLDTALDDLRRRLEADAGRYRTHVVLTADHGESFGEGGAIGHGRRVSDEQIRVPLFVVSPRLEPGVRREPVGSVDVAATLLDLGGLEETAFGEGRSLLVRRPLERRVFGMRRLFGPKDVERLVGGGGRPLSAHRFYAVAGERVFRGSSRHLDSGRQDPERSTILRSFGSFEEQLAEHASPVVGDTWTREALKALGYATPGATPHESGRDGSPSQGRTN